MNTYLLAWNPKRWNWVNLSKEADQTAAGKIVTERWSCGNTKKIEKGDRVFLVRLGVEPKGIMGSGWVSESPKLTTHWNEEKAKAGERNLSVICEWERIINPEKDSPLPLTRLQQGNLSEVHWTPQSSGVLIPSKIADELEKIWAEHIGASNLGNVFVDDEIKAYEGEERIALIRHRKREQKLRVVKLKQSRERNNDRLICKFRAVVSILRKFMANLGKNLPTFII